VLHKPDPAPSRKRPSQVSLHDIARICSLSVMTVSRALSGKGAVHPKTRERVLSAARKMSYVPNRLATNFWRQKTHSVGVLIPDIEHSIFPAVVRGIESVLSGANYHLYLSCSYDNPHREQEEVQAMLERRVDGILLAPSSMKESVATVSRIRTLGCPFVLLDRLIPGLEADAVTVDDYAGAFAAVTHLVKQGYRRILHLAGPADIWTCAERERGYRAALEKAGLEFRPGDVVHTGLSVEDGETAMIRILGGAPLQADAVFCVNDPVAVGAFKTLRKCGLRVPSDLGLVGFSGTLESEIMETPLTTVRQEARLIGQRAAQILLSRMTSETPGGESPLHEVVPTTLLVRESSLRKTQ